jgi:methionyl-tRNA formyltransferase
MLKKEDGRLDFTRPAKELERRVQAMNPWPGAWLEFNGEPLKVLKARAQILFTYMFQPPGARLVVGNLPAVMTGQDALLLEEVQPPGKKPMDGKSFLAGGREWK